MASPDFKSLFYFNPSGTPSLLMDCFVAVSPRMLLRDKIPVDRSKGLNQISKLSQFSLVVI